MQTIFLDRDGVINRNRARGDYVKSWEEFQFLPGALDAIARLTKAGFRLLVITNQACVGKGIVSWATMQDIQVLMTQEIALAGGQIEVVLFALRFCLLWRRPLMSSISYSQNIYRNARFAHHWSARAYRTQRRRCLASCLCRVNSLHCRSRC